MSEENVEQIGKLIDKLKEFDYVEEVYTNVVVATG
jgi:transcriptional/translational regulatory protein YebC/TACO1